MKAFLIGCLLLLAGCSEPALAPLDAPPEEGADPQPGPSDKDPAASPGPPAASDNETASPTGANSSSTPGKTPVANQTPDEARPPYWYPTQNSSRAWPPVASQGIRPGIDVVGGGQCTSNFLFHLDDERYFLGVAAHCFQTGSDPFYTPCPADGMEPGSGATIYTRTNEAIAVTLAYSSFWTMQENGEAGANECNANDFALVEIPASRIKDIHPAALGFQGPTGLAPADEYLDPGDALYAYGNSDTRPTFVLHGDGFASTGQFTDYTEGGWGVEGGPNLPPLIQGDSGGPVMDADGQAVGALSVLKTFEGQTRWTNIPRALWYMHEHEGWAPSLVTWQDFDP